MLDTFNGYRVVANSNLVKTKTVEVVKSRWEKFWDSVVRLNPCNAHLRRPDFETFSEPSMEVVIMHDQRIMCAHPAAIKRMEAALNESS